MTESCHRCCFLCITAEPQSSICYTCLPPSALTETPPEFPLLPAGLWIIGSLRLGAVGAGSPRPSPSPTEPLLAAPPERAEPLTSAPPRWSASLPPCLFSSLPFLPPLFTTLSLHPPPHPPFVSPDTASHLCFAFNHVSSLHPLFLHPWWNPLADTNRSPVADNPPPWAVIASLSPPHRW